MLIAKTWYEREEIYATVPVHLRERVNQIIDQYENKDVERLGLMIAKLKTKYERKKALEDVEQSLRGKVRQFVVDHFAKRERRKTTADIGEEKT